MNDEINRRKEVIKNKSTDLHRWSEPKNFESSWEARSLLTADLIPAGSVVLDIGCGMMSLEKHLPFGCKYMPMDLVKRDHRTLICDLNHDRLPTKASSEADVITMLGVFEYIYDVKSVFQQLHSTGKTLIFSYCGKERNVNFDRKSNGWVNDYETNEILDIARSCGYMARVTLEVDPIQTLFRLDPGSYLPPAIKKVHVLSYNNVGNFGDRLGYHLINEIVPHNTQISWGTLRPFEQVPRDVDLLIVGIGNSLFSWLIDEDLINAVKSSKASIGIFGTQYREQFPTTEFNQLLDVIGHWYARYEEDIFFFGKKRNNVTHLGDWLINLFPMAESTIDHDLSIGDEVLKNLPLDRTIQQIQKYKSVHSTRLHPLLCALTSANSVSYSEQNDFNIGVSGKFRSMFLDVFGRTFPENTKFSVDRDAVLTYKGVIRKNTDLIKEYISKILK
jgi:hypothetical protein